MGAISKKLFLKLRILGDQFFVLFHFSANLGVDQLELLDNSLGGVFQVVNDHIDEDFVHFELVLQLCDALPKLGDQHLIGHFVEFL